MPQHLHYRGNGENGESATQKSTPQESEAQHSEPNDIIAEPVFTKRTRESRRCGECEHCKMEVDCGLCDFCQVHIALILLPIL